MKKTTILALIFTLPLFTLAQNAPVNNEGALTYDLINDQVPEAVAAEYKSTYAEGIAFYNRGVYSLQRLDMETLNRDDLEKVHSSCIDMFKRAKPALESSCEQFPNDRKIIQALSGVYFALDDMDKHKQMKALLAAAN